MLETPDTLMLAILPVLLACSAFLSGSETALFSLTRHQRLRLSRSRTITASMLTRLMNAKQELLIAILLVNMFANVTYFVIGTVLVISLQERHLLSTTAGNVLNILAVLLLILLGEVSPKLLAARFAMQWASVAAAPLTIIYRVLSPLRIAIQASLVDPISRMLAPRHVPQALSTKDLEAMLELSQEQGVIDHEEEQMLQQVLSLGQLKVKDLMTPRVDVIALDLDDDPARLVALARERQFSRIPIYCGDIDHIQGFVYARQVLLNRPSTHADVKSLVRQVRFVPELQAASGLIVELRRRRMTMALAVDEFGGTAGLVTLEDVIGHIVDDIPRLDTESASLRVAAIGSGQWRVSADLSVGKWSGALSRINRVVGISTLGGLVTASLGRIAKVGDRVTIGNLAIEVESMDRQRIDTLRLKLDDKAPADITQGEIV